MPTSKGSSQMTPENIQYLAEKGIHELLGKMLQSYEARKAVDPAAKPVRCWIECLEDMMGKPRSQPPVMSLEATHKPTQPVVLPIEKIKDEVQQLHRTLQGILDMNIDLPAKVLERNALIHDLHVNFQQLVSPIARLIIEERNQYPETRSIQPTPGDPDTYIYGGLVFRFAVTPDTVFTFGTRESAAKVLGHELKGLSAVLGANLPGIHVPLSIQVRYLGLGLWVSTQLPLTAEGLVYGSLDDGDHMVRCDPEMAFLMQQLGEQLNLKSHRAGMIRETSKVIYGPADVQGYRCFQDNRLYLLGLSRLFPPATPDPDVKNSYLVRLLRPEAVSRHSKPLSSDAFSPYLRSKQDDDDVKMCSRLVGEWRLPHVVRRLQTMDADTLTPEQLVTIMHYNGVNCRYLGHLLPLTDGCPVRTLNVLCSEMVARTFRCIMEDAWYTLGLEGGSQAEFEEQTVEAFHLLFDRTSESEKFWSDVLLPRLSLKYGEHLVLINKRLLCWPIVFRRCCELLGVRFGMTDIISFKDFESSGAEKAPFGMTVQLVPVAKVPEFPEPTLAQRHLMEGRLLEAAAVNESILAKKLKLIDPMSPFLVPVIRSLAKVYGLLGEEKAETAENHLKRILAIRETDGKNECARAQALRELGEFHLLRRNHEIAHPYLEDALRLARQAYGNSHHVVASLLNLVGSVFYLRGEHKKSLDTFKMALDIRERIFGCEHPEYADSLVHIGMFYTNQGMAIQSKNFFQRAAKIISDTGNPVLMDAELARVQFHLAVATYYLAQYDEALELFKKCQPGLERSCGTKAPEVISCLEFILAIEHHHAPINSATMTLPPVMWNTARSNSQPLAVSEDQPKPVEESERKEGHDEEHPEDPGHETMKDKEERREEPGNEGEASQPQKPQAKAKKPPKPASQKEKKKESKGGPTDELQRLLAAGQYEQAIPIMQEFVIAYDKNPMGISTEDFIDMLTQYAHLLQHAARVEAVPAYQRLVDIKEAILGRQHLHVALALEDLANSFASHSMYPEAAHSFERAGSIWEAHIPGNEADLANCFEKLANLHYYFGRRTAALRVWDRVLMIRKKAFGDSDEGTVRAKKEMDCLYAEIHEMEAKM